MNSDAHHLILDALTDYTWRLCNQAADPRDADSLLAYVELRPDGLYEVTWVAHGIAMSTHDSLADLLREAGKLCADRRTSPREKPIPIPTVSPRARAAR